MVKLFKRKHNLDENPKLPEEVREYYASTKKRRTGLAVLLGVLSLITVLVISFGVYTFFDSIFSGIDKVAETTAVE
ncbi:MAG: hypothetical protein M3P98_02850, partial [bacterium]|nr:hypothetical protein [bacterium]